MAENMKVELELPDLDFTNLAMIDFD